MTKDEQLLGGYRVLDLTNEVGLLCGRVLADLGADVIKIEKPGGDAARNIGPFYRDKAHPEKSLYWFFANLNKRGITLNIETADGKEVFQRLVKQAHFVIESFRPGYMESLGLGYEELARLNTSVIVTSITPFGQTGPYAHYKVTDIVGMAMGGLMDQFVYSDTPGFRFSTPQFFFIGGLHGAMGSLVAHYHREVTGEGQHVDVSAQQAVVNTLNMVIESWEAVRGPFRAVGAYTVTSRPTGLVRRRAIWPAKDGYVYTGISGGAAPLMRATSEGLRDMANREGKLLEFKDFDFAAVDTLQMTQEEWDRWDSLFGEFIKTKTKQELMDEAVRKRMMLAPVTTTEDIVKNPQWAARELWIDVEHPDLGDTIRYPGFPAILGGARPQPQRPAPLIGEHNEEIYGQELGLSRQQLVMLKNHGII